MNDSSEIEGWGWGVGSSLVVMESTCLVLETMVKIPQKSQVLLMANAEWLMKVQQTRIITPQCSVWPEGLTSRIALSFLDLYKLSEEHLW